jgi:hypothetical protein
MALVWADRVQAPLPVLAPLVALTALTIAPHLGQVMALVSLLCPSVSEQHKAHRIDLLLAHIEREQLDVVTAAIIKPRPPTRPCFLPALFGCPILKPTTVTSRPAVVQVCLQELSCYWAFRGHASNTQRFLDGAAKLGLVHVLQTPNVPVRPLLYGSTGLCLVSKCARIPCIASSPIGDVGAGYSAVPWCAAS